MSPAAAATGSAALRSFEAQWLAREPDPLSALRQRAMQRFLELGLPTTRDESWRYTNLRQLSAQSFVDAPRAAAEPLLPTASLSLLGDAQGAVTVVVVNGHPLLPKRFDEKINGIEIIDLHSLSLRNPELLSRFLEPLPDAEQARWRLLNTALFSDGLYLKIGARVETPLIILHVATADRAGTAAYPRVIVDAAPGSSAIIIEHHVQQGIHAPLCNSATLLSLEQGAELEHYRVFATDPSSMHVDSLEVRQHKDSRCRQFTVVLGGGLVRTSLEANLNETGARLDNFALLVGHEDRHVDCVNTVAHRVPHTVSRQTARAIASGTSRVIFNSKVIVDAGASHSDSQQSCRGLLLSRPPKSTRDPSSKSIRTRSNARMAQPRDVSIRTCSSTCCRGVWTGTPRRACWSTRSSRMCSRA